MKNLFDVKGKNIIVTGATSGIGRYMALELAERGATVLAVSRREERLRELQNLHTNIKYFSCDLSQVGNLTADFAKMVALLNNSLDGMVYCAGVAARKEFVDAVATDWNHVLNVNLVAPAILFQQAGKLMVKNKVAGSLLAISSIADRCVSPSAILYGPSKAALSHFIRNLAYEYAKYKVRVNAIAPGWFLTEMTQAVFEDKSKREKAERGIPLGLPGKLEDLTGAMLLLISNAGNYITGEILTVDGGTSLNQLYEKNEL